MMSDCKMNVYACKLPSSRTIASITEPEQAWAVIALNVFLLMCIKQT